MRPGSIHPLIFHASIGGDEAMILVATGQVLEGRIPNAALFKVKQWCELHQAELQRNWARAMTRSESLESIEPLP